MFYYVKRNILFHYGILTVPATPFVWTLDVHEIIKIFLLKINVSKLWKIVPKYNAKRMFYFMFGFDLALHLTALVFHRRTAASYRRNKIAVCFLENLSYSLFPLDVA